MKKTLLLICLFMPAYLMAQTFTLNGNIKGLKNGDKVFLFWQNNGIVHIDSAMVNQGRFKFSGSVEHPEQASLYLHKNPLVTKILPGEILDNYHFYIEAAHITLTATDSLKNIQVSGSQVDRDYQAWKLIRKPAEDKFAALQKEYQQLPEDKKHNEQVIKQMIAREKQFMHDIDAADMVFSEKYPDSYLSLLALKQFAADSTRKDTALRVYMQLSSQLKKTREAKNIVALLSSSGQTKIGAKAADFEQQTPDGKAIKLSDFKGKYVLVDFWASWCGPCREENPNVTAAYHKYKDKGFTILGVSLDSPGKKDAWTKAIADDKLEWTQVSDLKGWDNMAALQYGVRSIPANFLIDPDGKIIAKGLRGEDLDKQLTAIFDGADK